MPSTELPYATYLAHLDADAERMAALAVGHLDDPVPSCPGWRVKDLLEHTAAVYLHKTACIRLGEPPQPWSPQPAVDTVEGFGSAYAGLRDELAAHQPTDPAWTWWAADQSVGFWARRMAQETLVHRLDAELAVGIDGALDEALSLDGVDEVLTLFLNDPRQEYDVVQTPPAVVLVSSGKHAWSVRLEPAAVSSRREDDPSAVSPEATISGSPVALERWLWGRGEIDDLEVSGSATVIALLSDRMVDATR